MSARIELSDTPNIVSTIANGARLNRLFHPAIQIFVDLGSIVGATVLSGILYDELASGRTGDPRLYFVVGAFMALIHNNIQHFMNVSHSEPRQTSQAAFGIAIEWTFIFLVVLNVVLLLGFSEAVSWGMLAAFVFASLTALPIGRLLLFHVAMGNRAGVGLIKPNIILIHEIRHSPGVEHRLARLGTNVNTIAIESFSMRKEEWEFLLRALHMAYLNSGAQGVYIAAPLRDASAVTRMIDALLPLPWRIIGFIPTSDLSLFEQCPFHFDEFAVLNVKHGPFTRLNSVAKRAMDIVLASTGIVITLPLMLIIAILIKIDTRGPVFFRQMRHGRGRKPFKIWKFRSMTVMEDGAAIPQAQRNDPRVTSVGSFLRRASLDEMPQLFNVIMGEMSMVGPRPHACAHDDQYGGLINDYMWRQHVRPGITGWAQINGLRGETRSLDQMRNRIELDCWYMRNWSIALDITILVQTVFTVFRDDAAY